MIKSHGGSDLSRLVSLVALIVSIISFAMSYLQSRRSAITGVRAGKQSDEELFWWCHGYFPDELQGKITREVRQYRENGFRVTITLEAVD